MLTAEDPDLPKYFLIKIVNFAFIIVYCDFTFYVLYNLILKIPVLTYRQHTVEPNFH